jgi:hypothetical protein
VASHYTSGHVTTQRDFGSDLGWPLETFWDPHNFMVMAIWLMCEVALRTLANAPNSVTHLNRTPIFEWYVVWCASKNGYQKDRHVLE